MHLERRIQLNKFKSKISWNVSSYAQFHIMASGIRLKTKLNFIILQAFAGLTSHTLREEFKPVEQFIRLGGIQSMTQVISYACDTGFYNGRSVPLTLHFAY